MKRKFEHLMQNHIFMAFDAVDFYVEIYLSLKNPFKFKQHIFYYSRVELIYCLF